MLKKRKNTSGDMISDAVREVHDIMLRENLGEVEWEESDGFSMKLSRQGAAVAVHTAGMLHAGKSYSKKDEKDEVKEPELSYIRSPMNGVFYSASSPGADSFVKIDDEITTGTTVCIIEAMKLMNEVQVERNCRIKAILVDNATSVKTGQPLFEIDE